MDDSTVDLETRAYHPGGGAGLTSLLASLGPAMSIALEQAMSERSGGAAPPSPGALPRAIGRFTVLGEVGRGGIGVVYRVHDRELGRELALKVLQEPFRGSTEACQRFIEECQIGGQLQHPGIVPIHEMGVLPGPIPYFTMKLVKGKTLAALLEARRAPEEDRQNLLSIFEQVAQALAYAHSRGVIHRDLKPSNIMVGAFGEVQVMDWGLARAVANGGVHDERRARKSHLASAISVVHTARAGGDRLSRAGSVMGTPSYMPPEQARGEIHELDERSDVFGLGAILCEILTGRPPYAGATADEVWQRAQAGDTSEAIAILGACDADPSLIALAKECLHPEPRLRPRDAGGVARVLREHFDTMDRKALEAQAAAAEATVRAHGARQARRITCAIVVALLLALAAGIGGALYLEHARAERATDAVQAAERALAEVEARTAEARKTGAHDVSRWDAALEAARHAEIMVERSGDPRLAAAVADRRAAIERKRREAQADAARSARDRDAAERLLLLRLRQAHADREAAKSLGAEYAQVFSDLGIDPFQPDASSQVASSSIALELSRALDEWAGALRRIPAAKRAEWEPLERAAVDAVPDALAREVRLALLSGQKDTLVGLARQIIAAPILPSNALELVRARADADTASGKRDPLPSGERPTAASLDLLLSALEELGDSDLARDLGRKAHVFHRDDFWIHHRLGTILETGAPGEALGHRAAVHAARPDLAHTWIDLGWLHARAEEWDEAVPVLERARDLPDAEPAARELLAEALRRTLDLDRAAAEYEHLIREQPARTDLRSRLGETLLTAALFQSAAAAARSREAAADAYREAAALSPGDATALAGWSAALEAAGRPLEAASAARKLLEVMPDSPLAQLALGRSLLDAERTAEAATALEACAARQASRPEVHLLLALARGRQGDAEGFLGALASAVRSTALFEPILREDMKLLDPELIERQRRREVRRHEPRWREAERFLGAMTGDGRVRAAMHSLLGSVRLHLRDVEGGSRSLEAALASDERDAAALSGLALVRQIEARRRPERREALLEEALRLLDSADLVVPESSRLRGQRACVLDDLGRTAESLSLLADAVAREPGQAHLQLNLAWALLEVPRLADADTAARSALELDPESPMAHRLLGLIEHERSRPHLALAGARRVLELDRDSAVGWANVGFEELDAGRLVEARRTWERALQLEPEHPWFQAGLAETLEQLGEWDEAVRLSEQASKLPGCRLDVFATLVRYHRKLGAPCAALDALRRWLEAIRTRGRRLDADDLDAFRKLIDLGKDLLPCPELTALESAVSGSLAAPDPDPLLRRIYLELWLLRPFDSPHDPVALATELNADSGRSELGTLELMARVLHGAGLREGAVAALEELGRLLPLADRNRERLAAWRAEVLPMMPTFESVDAFLDAGDPLLGPGSSVRYFPGLTEPPLGPAWIDPGYDDSAWAETTQPCGFEASESIALPIESLHGRPASLYVRSRFEVPALREVHGIRLAYRAADGVVIWLNGAEVGRLAAGAPGSMPRHDARASELDEEVGRWEALDVPGNRLREGTNVLCFHVLDRPSARSGLYVKFEVHAQRSAARDRRAIETLRATGADAEPRARYMEGRVLEREGKLAEAAAEFERALSEAGESPQPFLGLLDCLRALEGREAGEASFRSRTAGLKLPRVLAAARPVPSGRLRPDDGVEVQGSRPALEAPSSFTLDPAARHEASIWELWPESADLLRLPLYRHRSSRSLSRLELPAGLLFASTAYRWKVAHAMTTGQVSPFSREARFQTGRFATELHRFELSEHFNRDVVANPGDVEDDSWDQSGWAWVVEGWNGVAADGSVRGFPADGRIGLHQLAHPSGKNSLELLRSDRAEVRLQAPSGAPRLDCLRFLVGAGGEGADLRIRLEYMDGPPEEARLPCIDWTRLPSTQTSREAHVICILQALPVIQLSDRGRLKAAEPSHQLFEVLVPLSSDRRLARVVLAPRPEDFEADTSHVHILSLVGVACHD